MVNRRQLRYQTLRKEHFTPLEARELSILPKSTPALKLVRQERTERWERFENIASWKLSRGQWRRRDIPAKWVKNLARMYSVHHWRVQEGPVGKQPRMKKGDPNPWSLYRDAERRTGGPEAKRYVSPWESRKILHGHTPLQKGLVFVQGAEKKLLHGEISKTQVRKWVAEKEGAILTAKGKRRAQLIIEKNRLERLL